MLVVVGFGVVVVGVVVGVVAGSVVESPSQETAHCLSQHCSPEGQSMSVLQSEHKQSVLVSHSPGQLFAAQVSSQLWQPTVLKKSQTGPTGTVYLQFHSVLNITPTALPAVKLKPSIRAVSRVDIASSALHQARTLGAAHPVEAAI